MAPGPKQPMSGLRTVKRDFSSSSILLSASQESASSGMDIPWDKTPPKQRLSGLEQRLKDIQDALTGQIVNSEAALAASSQKRPSPSSTQLPAAKRRQLPNSWNQPADQNRAPPQRASGAARSGASSADVLVVPSATKTGATDKPAPVFLSQEQTHILRLVEQGQSLFYTGSAGEWPRYGCGRRWIRG